MPRPTSGRNIEMIEKLRRIAEHDPMKAVETLLSRVFSNPPVENTNTRMLK